MGSVLGATCFGWHGICVCLKMDLTVLSAIEEWVLNSREIENKRYHRQVERMCQFLCFEVFDTGPASVIVGWLAGVFAKGKQTLLNFK